MSFRWNGLGDWIMVEAKNAAAQVVIVSPFIKLNAFKKFIVSIPETVPLSIYTRWRIDEIAQGVSDIQIWDVLKFRGNTKLSLIQNLHSKYYRFDEHIFVGSANLTDAGMTWSRSPNLETLISNDQFEVSNAAFELLLQRKSVEVTEEIYQRTKFIVDEFKRNSDNLVTPAVDNILSEGLISSEEIAEIQAVYQDRQFWIPVTRSTDIIFDIYKGRIDAVSKDVLVGAYLDLSFLEIPANLDKPSFIQYVASRLEMEPLIMRLDEFLSESRRFGEMRYFLSQYVRADASHHWQTIMRWLLFFMPHKYSATVANYSEIFTKIERKF